MKNNLEPQLSGNTIILFGSSTNFAKEVIDTCKRLELAYIPYENMESPRVISDAVTRDLLDLNPNNKYKKITSLGYPWTKQTAVELADKEFDFSWTSLVDPTTILGSDVEIGEGSYINAGCVIGSGSKIGKHVTINRAVNIGHDVSIDDFTFIGPGVTICGKVSIGAAVFIGAGSIVIDKVEIGSKVNVGAGTLVTKNFKGPVSIRGVPAKLF
jgi:sugar O-acyltransferase (sialic acid O-acetyltransferase NeuD family)